MIMDPLIPNSPVVLQFDLTPKINPSPSRPSKKSRTKRPEFEQSVPIFNLKMSVKRAFSNYSQLKLLVTSVMNK